MSENTEAIQPYVAPTDLSELDEELAEEPGFNPVSVRVKIVHANAMFDIPGLPNTDQLEVVVLNSMRRRTCYPRMVSDEATEELLQFTTKRPICSSDDYVTGNLADADWDHAPEAAIMIKNKIAEGALNCVNCPLNQWGSVTLLGSTGRGKVCAESRQLCLWKPGWNVPVILSVPSSSLKTWDQYCSSLVIGNYKPHYVVTRFGLEKRSASGGKNYSVMNIKFLNAITDEIKAELLSTVVVTGKQMSLAKALINAFKMRSGSEGNYTDSAGEPAATAADADDLGEDF